MSAIGMAGILLALIAPGASASGSQGSGAAKPVSREVAPAPRVVAEVLGMTRPWQAVLLRRRLRQIEPAADVHVSVVQARALLMGKPGSWIPPSEVRDRIRSLALDAGRFQVETQGHLTAVEGVFHLRLADPEADFVLLVPASDLVRREFVTHSGRRVAVSGEWRFGPHHGTLQVDRLTAIDEDPRGRHTRGPR
jgi:hypothetical protein